MRRISKRRYQTISSNKSRHSAFRSQMSAIFHARAQRFTRFSRLIASKTLACSSKYTSTFTL